MIPPPPPPPGADATSTAAARDVTATFSAASPEAVFARIDQNKDGVITREEFERAVWAGALVVEEEPPKDMWLDSLGRNVFGGVPPQEDPPVILASETATAATFGAPMASGARTSVTTVSSGAPMASGARTSVTTVSSGAPVGVVPGGATVTTVETSSSAVVGAGPPAPPPAPPAAAAGTTTTTTTSTYTRNAAHGTSGLGSAAAQARVPVPPPPIRPLQPEGSPWAPGGGDGQPSGDATVSGDQDTNTPAKSFGASMFDALMWRLGLSSVWSSDGHGDLGVYYTMKNNNLNSMFAHMRNVWVFVGFFVLSLMVYIPVWDANRLLKDPAFLYFGGKTVPRAILSVCLSLPVFYVCTVSLIFKRGALKIINEQTMLGVALCFFTALGFALVLFSFPLAEISSSTYADIAGACATGPKVRELYQTSQALQVLRSGDESCAVEYTVASCAGYQATSYTEVLEAMEQRYKCSGFCYQSVIVEAAENPPMAGGPPALVQKDAENVEATQTPSLLQVSAEDRIQHSRKKHQDGHVTLGAVEPPPAPVRGVASPLRPAPLRVKPQSLPGLTFDTAAEKEAWKEDSLAAMKEVGGRQLWSKGQLTPSSSASSAIRGAKAAAEASAPSDQPPYFPDINEELDPGWAMGTQGGITQWGPGQPSAAMIPPQVAADDSVMPYMLTAPAGDNTTAVAPYAPTLFSTTNWKASCDGMSASAMTGVMDVSLTFFNQGVIMMLISLIIGFAQLLGFCYAPKYQRF